ncbi:nitronate monooxygenase [Bdellovibrio sp. qaytius]|nr:nitronate monooxygenase [Bdellovibrio sp. qaytius]
MTTQSSALTKIETPLTKMLGIRYPIIQAPMFLVSNVDMVVAASEAGAIGTFPALNYRPVEKYIEALKEMKARTKKPIGLNIIVNKSNTRAKEDLKHALDAGVNLFITSLGSPKEVIAEAHKNGAKVVCDVVNLEHAKKVQDLGADGVIAVGTGAGGHAGPLSPIVLVNWLKHELEIPIIAAGGIANGATMASMMAVGAAGVSIGTRFIASTEAKVEQAYKDAIVNSSPEDIVMTTRVSGTPAAVINTPYVQKMGLELPWYFKLAKDQKTLKKYIVPLIHYLGSKSLEQAATGPSWKTVWSAGQSVGLVDDIISCEQIIKNIVNEYEQTLRDLPKVQ